MYQIKLLNYIDIKGAKVIYPKIDRFINASYI